MTNSSPIRASSAVTPIRSGQAFPWCRSPNSISASFPAATKRKCAFPAIPCHGAETAAPKLHHPNERRRLWAALVPPVFKRSIVLLRRLGVAIGQDFQLRESFDRLAGSLRRDRRTRQWALSSADGRRESRAPGPGSHGIHKYFPAAEWTENGQTSVGSGHLHRSSRAGRPRQCDPD